MFNMLELIGVYLSETVWLVHNTAHEVKVLLKEVYSYLPFSLGPVLATRTL